MRSTHQSYSVSLPLRHGQCDQLTNHILSVSPSVTISAINSPITFYQSPPPSRSVRTTHQSHSISLPLRHGQCDQLTNHILSVSPSVTISAINSPITFCQSPPPSRSVRSTHQLHSVSLPLRHGQCDQLTNHILSVSPSVAVSAINSPIVFCQSPPPSRSVRSTHQLHSVNLPLRHGQCDQLTNHILSVSPSVAVSAINSPIIFCQSPPPSRPVRSTHQSHSISHHPPPRSVRSTHQLHSVSLPLRHAQCDQLTNHILSVSQSATVSAINSPITFCQSPLRHGQGDQLTNHILPVSPPPRSVRSIHQSQPVSFPLRHGQCDHSPITFCQSPPPSRSSHQSHSISHHPPSRSVRSTHQLHSVSLPLRHGQCVQITNHILSVSPSVTISAINSPITFCQTPPPSRSVRSTHQSYSVSFPPPSRSVRSTHQSHYVSLPLRHGQCDQLTSRILSVITLRHGQCDQLTNYILSVSPSVTVSAINSPIIFCQFPNPPRSVRSTHQSHSVSLPLRHGQCDQLTNHILSVSPSVTVSAINSPIAFYQSSPSATVSAINSPITFCQSPPPSRSVRSTYQSYSVSLPLRHGQCDQLTNRILSVITLRHNQCDQLTNHILSVSPSVTVRAINSPITFCQSPPPSRSVRSTHQSYSVSFPIRHGQCDQLTNHILPVSPSVTVSAINSPITFCKSPPPSRSVRSTHQSHSVSLPLRHGQDDHLTNHIPIVSPSVTVSAINSPIIFCQSPPRSRSVRSTHQSHSISHHPPPRSVRSTHQLHSVSLPLRHGQCDQLTNHILSVSQSATVSAINSPITFCQSPLRHGQGDQLTNHILPVSPSASDTVNAINSPITFCQSPTPSRSGRSTHQSHSVSHLSVTVRAINSSITFCQSPPPSRSVRSTHQSHYVSLPLRHGQCDQFTNHILSVSPSVTVTAINSTIAFYQSSPSATVSAINSPITFCQSPPPSRSGRSTHQSHFASLPLRHGQCDQLTNHILSVYPSVTVSAINSPIIFCQFPHPSRSVRSTHQSHSISHHPPPRSVRSTHQSHSDSLPLRHGQCDQLTNHSLSVSASVTVSAINSPITFYQSSPSVTVSAINSPIIFCQFPHPSRSVRSTHQSHSISHHPPSQSGRSTHQSHSDSLPLRHGQCDQLTNHSLSVSASVTVSAINSPITFCQFPNPPRSVRSTHQSHSVSLPLRHDQCDQLTDHILSVSPSVTVRAINSPITVCQSPPPSQSGRSTHQSQSVSLPLRHGQCDQLTNHSLSVSPSVTVSAINSPITFCQSPPPPRSVRSTHQSHYVSLPLRHDQCDQLTNHIMSVSPSVTVSAINSPITLCQSPPPSRSVRSTHQSHYVSLPLRHGQCDQLTNHIMSVSPLRHGQCDQLANHIPIVSPSVTVRAIN